MLWLCLHFPLLPLSALAADATKPAVVVDQYGAQRWLITPSGNSPAGTPLTRALTLEPELHVLVRKPAAERAALHSLACWIYRFGQPVTFELQELAEPGRLPRALLWVEIGCSLSLFGGLDALCRALRDELRELDHPSARLGIAPTRAAAALLACGDLPAPVRNTAALQASLAGLPLQLLHWPGNILHALRGVGCRRLGELFSIPREAFAKRFGTEQRLSLDRLIGLAPEPCESVIPPESFCRRFELSAEIEDVERLQFPLKRLCGELQAYLRTRDRGLRSVSLIVTHAGARETCIHARFVDSHRDARRLFDALHERLERDGLPLPARELRLMAEDFDEASVPQSDLFDTRAGQAQRWAAAVERIRARLGDDRVWTPQALADHRPERALHRLPATETSPITDTPRGFRPSLLLAKPWPMPAPPLPAGAGFERIESGWWDGHEIRRDYYVLDINGARAWVYRDLDTQAWHLHGWFS